LCSVRAVRAVCRNLRRNPTALDLLERRPADDDDEFDEEEEEAAYEPQV